MNNVDLEYFRLLNLVLEKGKIKKNRTGIDTLGVFGAQARFDISNFFPLLTTKKIYTKSIIHELLWFLSGSTNIKYLVDNNVHIWDDNAYDNYRKNYNPKISEHLYVAPYDKENYIKAIKNNASGFANKWGNLGEGIYGSMWRFFPYVEREMQHETDYIPLKTVDQIQKVIDKLKSNPDDRRLIVSAWHPYWVDNCALPPCHVLYQFHTEELSIQERKQFQINRWPDKKNQNIAIHNQSLLESYPASDETWNRYLDESNVPQRRINCQLYQRSCDLFLGVPFNIASYSLLLSMVAQVVNMVPGEFIHTYGDLHLYTNHVDQAKEQLSRNPLELPTLKLNPDIKNIFSFKYEDIEIVNYNSHPAIKAEMAV